MNRIGPAYVALGLFKDQDDIDSSPDQSAVMANVRPGDIKYKDLNGDKKIDQYDRTYIGDPYIPRSSTASGFRRNTSGGTSRSISRASRRCRST